MPIQESNMSFSVSESQGAFEIGYPALSSLFGQRSNFFSFKFYRMIFDLISFNRNVEKFSAKVDLTVGELLNVMGRGDWFRERYFLPMCAAIWSSPLAEVLEYPASWEYPKLCV